MMGLTYGKLILSIWSLETKLHQGRMVICKFILSIHTFLFFFLARHLLIAISVKLTNLFNWIRYKGTYCSQEVAIKVLKPERVNSDMQTEFAQEVFIMRFVWIILFALFGLWYLLFILCLRILCKSCVTKLHVLIVGVDVVYEDLIPSYSNLILFHIVRKSI